MTTEAESEILKRLARMETLLSRLVTPVAAEEARQLLSASPEQRREHNKGVLERARQQQKLEKAVGGR